MNGNIANGGLVINWRGSVVFAKPSEWFLNAGDDYIYYSDRSNGNWLFRKRGPEDAGTVLLKEPCSYVTLHGDDIYYINEDRARLARCSTEGDDRTRYPDEVREFAITADGGVYTNPRARRLCLVGQTAYFADADNDFALTIATIAAPGEAPVVFADIKPSFLNVHEDNVYFSDRSRANALCRLDRAGGRITIFGGPAECLHIIDDWLYFLSGKTWVKLSLRNFGEAEEA